MATVMKKMIAQCEQAFHSKQPFILVDTEEKEIMWELASACKLVDFHKAEFSVGERHKPYFAFIHGTGPAELKTSTNLYPSSDLNHCLAGLQELSKIGGSLDNGQVPSKAKLASMFLIHLTKEDMPTITKYLHLYAEEYLSCYDAGSVLRNSCVFLYGDPDLMPAALKQYTEFVSVDYPDQAEIASIVKDMAEQAKEGFENPEDIRTVARELAGFSLMDVKRTLRKLLWTDHVEGRAMIHNPKIYKKTLLDIKKQALLKSGGLLELYVQQDDGKNGKDGKAALGGMESYREYVDSIREKVLKAVSVAYERGTPPPKGILLCGVPGCGKSEAAKALYTMWNREIPMLKMEMGRLLAGHVGESERYMREALKQAEAMAPCILWIDELDKGFSGAASSGSSDGGTFKRMFGNLLTWMQETEKECFIFATANDISQLPDEFFRNGRFDARFSVFMPTHEECREIFKVHMRKAEEKRRKTAEKFGWADPGALFLTADDVHYKNGCYDDECLDKIMQMFTEEKDIQNPVGVKFVSGADIRLIVNTALDKMTEEDLQQPLPSNRWEELVKEAVNSPFIGTQGDSAASLDRIAECYVRLLRGRFVPASGDGVVLFKKENYSQSSNGAVYQSAKGCPSSWAYDIALYHAILKRMDSAAEYVERSERAGKNG